MDPQAPAPKAPPPPVHLSAVPTAAAPTPAVAPTVATPASGPVTLLIVEDDRVLQDLYLDSFGDAGFTVIQAFDGMEALDQLKAHPEVGLVLLDVMLPKLSGYDVLAQIRRTAPNPKVPVIIVSALGDIDDQARGLNLGANDYITKGEMLPSAVIEKIKAYAVPVSRPASQ